jgi:hypothetical protein
MTKINHDERKEKPCAEKVFIFKMKCILLTGFSGLALIAVIANKNAIQSFAVTKVAPLVGKAFGVCLAAVGWKITLAAVAIIALGAVVRHCRKRSIEPAKTETETPKVKNESRQSKLSYLINCMSFFTNRLPTLDNLSTLPIFPNLGNPSC